MAKLYVVDSREQTRVPFLRGILTRSLQDAGMSFVDAYEMASGLRESLGEDEQITSIELRKRVTKLLRANYGEEIATRYRDSHKAAPATIHVENGEGVVTPFSRGRHKQFLEASGLSTRDSEPVTARIYEHLLRVGVRRISTSRLSYLTWLTLKKSLGADAAERYLVWFSFFHSGKPMLILIGGTVGCGKSTMATALAHRLDIVRIQSTDMLREVMRMMMPERLLPVLHTSSFNAWRKLPFADDRHADIESLIAEGYQSQAELLALAGEAVLGRARTERVSLILEGVHVQPSFAESLKDLEDAVVVPIVLAVLKQKELRRRIEGRGTLAPRRRARRYLKEFEAIWRLQSFLLSEADRCEVPIVSNLDKDKAIREVLLAVIDRLREDYTGEPRKVFGIPRGRAGRSSRESPPDPAERHVAAGNS